MDLVIGSTASLYHTLWLVTWLVSASLFSKLDFINRLAFHSHYTCGRGGDALELSVVRLIVGATYGERGRTEKRR